MKRGGTTQMIRVMTMAMLAGTAWWSAPTASFALENELSDVAQTAFDQIGKCLEPKSAELSILFLLDASTSLSEDTDEIGLRGPILQQAVGQLTILSESRDVNVAVSSFDLGYDMRREWVKLDTTESKRIQSEIPTWIKNKGEDNDNGNRWWGDGGGTNWLAALRGGQETMNTSPDAKTACKIIIWLTDGGIKVDGGDNSIGPNTKAMEEICGTNPKTGDVEEDSSVIAEIRSSGTHLVGVLLKDAKYLNGLDSKTKIEEESRFSYMKPVTEGFGSVNNAAFTNEKDQIMPYACGPDPIPGDHAYGALLSGDSPIALSFLFGELTNGISGGLKEKLTPMFPQAFTIPPGINSLNVQIAGDSWKLSGPNGIKVSADGTNSNPEYVRVSQEGQLANIRIDGMQKLPGEWMIDVKGDEPQAVIYRNAQLEWKISDVTFRVGEEADITFELIDALDNKPIKADLYEVAPFKVEVQQGSSENPELICPQGSFLTFTCPITPQQVGAIKIMATTILTTASPKLSFTQEYELSGDVAASAEYPSVQPGTVELTDLIGKQGKAAGLLTLVGPEKGSGEVCFSPVSNIEVLQDAVDRIYEYAGPQFGGECYALSENGTSTIPISIETRVTASTSVEIAIPVTLKSRESTKEETQNILVKFTTTREGSPNLWVLIGLLILGLGLPISLLYLQARSAAKLSLKGLQSANIPVNIWVDGDNIRITRLGGASKDDLIQLNDWEYLPSSADKSRSFTTSSGVRLEAHTPKNPLGTINASAVAAPGILILTSMGRVTDGSAGQMGLSPVNQWFMTTAESELRSEKEPITGTLVAFTNPTGGGLEKTSRELSLSVQDSDFRSGWATLRKNLHADNAAAPRGEKKTDPTPTPDQKSHENPFPSDSPSGNFGATPSPDITSPFTAGEAMDKPPSSKESGASKNPFDNL